MPPNKLLDASATVADFEESGMRSTSLKARLTTMLLLAIARAYTGIIGPGENTMGPRTQRIENGDVP